MTAASLGFYASASLALLAGLAAVIVRRRDRALGAFAIAVAALLVPLIQLEAAAVAAATLLAATGTVVLLGIVSRTSVEGQGQRSPIGFWVPAGLGLAGFAWVVLATGSRQVVDHGEPLAPDSKFGDGGALLLELGTSYAVPALLVALLALCAVIAAVLNLVGSSAEPSVGKAS